MVGTSAVQHNCHIDHMHQNGEPCLQNLHRLLSLSGVVEYLALHHDCRTCHSIKTLSLWNLHRPLYCLDGWYLALQHNCHIDHSIKMLSVSRTSTVFCTVWMVGTWRCNTSATFSTRLGIKSVYWTSGAPRFSVAVRIGRGFAVLCRPRDT